LVDEKPVGKLKTLVTKASGISEEASGRVNRLTILDE